MLKGLGWYKPDEPDRKEAIMLQNDIDPLRGLTK
jgi:hypothetical protein